MGFFDGFKDEVEKQLDNVFSNVSTYLIGETLTSPPLVKITSQGQGGNLTAEQIAAGLRGTPPVVSSPTTPKAEVARAEGDGMGGYKGTTIFGAPLMTVVGVLALFYIFKGKL